MIRFPLGRAAIALAGVLTLSACYDDGYGYGGVSVGAGYYDGGYYGPGYYDGSYYGGYGGYGGGYYGWNDGFYYPGTGFYVFDNGGRRYRWNDRQRSYWEGRRREWQNGNPGRNPPPNWNGGRPNRPGGWNGNRPDRPGFSGQRPDRPGGDGAGQAARSFRERIAPLNRVQPNPGASAPRGESASPWRGRDNGGQNRQSDGRRRR